MQLGAVPMTQESGTESGTNSTQGFQLLTLLCSLFLLLLYNNLKRK